MTANLLDDEIVELFPGQITVSDIKLKFLHDKGSKKDWNVSIKGMRIFFSQLLSNPYQGGARVIISQDLLWKNALSVVVHTFNAFHWL